MLAGHGTRWCDAIAPWTQRVRCYCAHKNKADTGFHGITITSTRRTVEAAWPCFEAKRGSNISVLEFGRGILTAISAHQRLARGHSGRSSYQEYAISDQLTFLTLRYAYSDRLTCTPTAVARQLRHRPGLASVAAWEDTPSMLVTTLPSASAAPSGLRLGRLLLEPRTLRHAGELSLHQRINVAPIKLA